LYRIFFSAVLKLWMPIVCFKTVGMLFHSCGAYAENARSPTVFSLVFGTDSWGWDAERGSLVLTFHCSISDIYTGARLLTALKTKMRTLYSTRALTGYQWSCWSIFVTLSYLWEHLTIRAALFWIRCNQLKHYPY